MSADFSFDEFTFNEGVFEDFLKDLDADQKAQESVDMTFQSFDPPMPLTNNKTVTNGTMPKNINNITVEQKQQQENNQEEETYDASFLMGEEEQLFQLNNLSNYNNNMQFYNPRANNMPIPMPVQIPTTGFESAFPPNMPYYYHPNNDRSFYPPFPANNSNPGPFDNHLHFYPPQIQPQHHMYMATGHISPPLPTNVDKNLLRQIQQDDEREKQMFAALDVDESTLAATPRGYQNTHERATNKNGIVYPPNPLPMSRDVSEISVISQLSSQSNHSMGNNSHKRKSLPRSPMAHYNYNNNNNIPMIYPGDINNNNSNGPHIMMSEQQYYTGSDGQVYPIPFYLPSSMDMNPQNHNYYSNNVVLPYDGFTQAAHKIQRVSHPLLNFPQTLFDAFNGGDLKKVKKMIQETTNKDCLLMTPALTYSAEKVVPELKNAKNNTKNDNNNNNDHSQKAYIQGEKYVEEFFDAMSEIHPDAVWIAKKVRYQPPQPVILPTINYHKMKQQNYNNSINYADDDSSNSSNSNHDSSLSMLPSPLTLQVPLNHDTNTNANINNDSDNNVKMFSSITCRVYFAGTRVAPNLAALDPLLEASSDTEYLFHYRGHFLVDELENKELLTPPEIHAMHELERNCPSLSVFGKGTMTLYMVEEEEKIAMWDIQWKVTSFRASDA